MVAFSVLCSDIAELLCKVAMDFTSPGFLGGVVSEGAWSFK